MDHSRNSKLNRPKETNIYMRVYMCLMLLDSSSSLFKPLKFYFLFLFFFIKKIDLSKQPNKTMREKEKEKYNMKRE